MTSTPQASQPILERLLLARWQHAKHLRCLTNLDRVVEKCSTNFLEPMRYTIGNNDHVSLDQLMHIATINAGATDLVGLSFFCVNSSSPGDERGCAFHYINDVG